MKLDLNGPMPNITPAQIIAVIGAMIALLVALGVPISSDKRDAIVSLATVLLPVLVGADAVIRHGRNRHLVPEPAPVPDDAPAPAVGILDGNDAELAMAHNGGGNGTGAYLPSITVGGS